MVTLSGVEIHSIRVSSVLPRASDHKSLGRVNHCSLHSRLPKFRGLMDRVKYGAVIDRKTRLFVIIYVIPSYKEHGI